MAAIRPPVEPPPRPKSAAEANPNLLRDRLANERTFLAWLRTGIAISSLGFVVARFDIFLYEMARVGGRTPESTRATIPLGVVLVLAGPLIILLASFRYLHTDRALLANRPDSRRLVRSIIVSITVGSVIAGAALVLHLLTLWPE
jgi:putative membrane protein